MNVTSQLVLPADVILVPVTDLPPHVRAHLDCDDADYAVTRPRSRTPSKIVDAHAAALLKQFRAPATIVDAVIRYSMASGSDAEAVLMESYPLLRGLVNSRLLVTAGSSEAEEILLSLEAGDQVGAFEVLACIQSLDDTELYQAKCDDGSLVALKVTRNGRDNRARRQIAREARILKHLNGIVAPKLRGEGALGERRYIATEWCTGVTVSVAAEELRRRATNNRQDLLRLCGTVLDAYARLHQLGVIHADVHPRNVLVDSSGAVRIIDYGLAHVTGVEDDDGAPERGGVGFYFDPEFARARMTRQTPPPPTLMGEQYAIGALIYFLLTGAHYLEFSLEKQAMLRQIAEEGLLPFASRGWAPWPAVEQVLARALCKEPSDRFSSTSDFAIALRGVDIPSDSHAPHDEVSLTNANALLDRVVRQISAPNSPSTMVEPPTCSITYGAAGVAYALYRIACIRDDPALLANADLWCTAAAQEQDQTRAFCNVQLGLDSETVGQVSPYHTEAGIHCVQTLISHAMGDGVSQQRAMGAFIAASERPCRSVDLTLGRGGTLLACSLLLDIDQRNQPLRAFGQRTLEGIWAELEDGKPILESTALRYLGIAHGWAGILYATLRWSQASGAAPPGDITGRIGQLAECAESRGRGVRWRRLVSSLEADYMTGWCNGSAGFVHLWTLADVHFPGAGYLALAEKAAWNAWEGRDHISSICCGLAGRAYGLLCMYRHTRDAAWLGRARELAERAALMNRWTVNANSLYKGELGVALLAADLTKPEESCLPFFEAEGWLPVL